MASKLFLLAQNEHILKGAVAHGKRLSQKIQLSNNKS